jgi:uncharacterized short protein YbdD (DUF466 family)
MRERIASFWALVWRTLRAITGDDAYERYAEHERSHRRTPLDRRAFYVTEQDRRFSSGPTRCC